MGRVQQCSAAVCVDQQPATDSHSSSSAYYIVDLLVATSTLRILARQAAAKAAGWTAGLAGWLAGWLPGWLAAGCLAVSERSHASRASVRARAHRAPSVVALMPAPRSEPGGGTVKKQARARRRKKKGKPWVPPIVTRCAF